MAALAISTLRWAAEAMVGERLAASWRRPLTAPVLAGAVRAVLATEPGLFAPVATHTGRCRRSQRPTGRCASCPTRTSIADLESALDAAGVPCRTEATSLV